MNDIDLSPATLDDVRKSIEQLLTELVRTQRVAIDLGNKLIALNDERLRRDGDWRLRRDGGWVLRNLDDMLD